MEIKIEHFDGQYPSFNIMLHQGQNAEPFLVIKGCKIIEVQNGPFISYPARKQDNGKYWKHVYGSDRFNEAVIQKARAGKPEQRRPPPPRQAPSQDGFKARQLEKPSSGFDDMDSDVPF